MASPPCVADTSWLYAILDGRDEFHDAAVVDAGSREEIHVPSVVLGETLLLVQRRAQKRRLKDPHGVAMQALEGLASKAHVFLASPEPDVEAVAEVWRSHKKLTYPDAVGVAAALRLNVDLCTYDARQMRAFRSDARKRHSS